MTHINATLNTGMFVRLHIVEKTIGNSMLYIILIIEPRHEKTGLRGFRPGLTQTGLCNH